MKKSDKKSAPQTSAALTLLNLSDHNKQYDEMQTVNVADGKFTLKINKKFSLTKIQDVIDDFKKAVGTIKKEKSDVDDEVKGIIIYHMCIVKQFTSLPLRHLDLSNKTDVLKFLEVAKELTDSSIFKEIMDSFDIVELAKVIEALKESNKIIEEISDQYLSTINSEVSEVNVIDNGSDSADNPTESE